MFVLPRNQPSLEFLPVRMGYNPYVRSLINDMAVSYNAIDTNNDTTTGPHISPDIDNVVLQTFSQGRARSVRVT